MSNSREPLPCDSSGRSEFFGPAVAGCCQQLPCLSEVVLTGGGVGEAHSQLPSRDRSGPESPRLAGEAGSPVLPLMGLWATWTSSLVREHTRKRYDTEGLVFGSIDKNHFVVKSSDCVGSTVKLARSLF